MPKIRTERLPDALMTLQKLMRVAPRPRGDRQKRLHAVITEGLALLAVFVNEKDVQNGLPLFHHLLGVALGVGAITESQCARIMLMLVEPDPAHKKARH